MTAAIEVDLELVEEPTHALRQVNEEGEQFKGIVASMRRDGYWPSHPIEVTRSTDNQTYVVAGAGMHRHRAARRAGLKKVWVSVLEKALTDAQLVERQIVAEATHVEARRVEFGRHLRLLQQANEGITLVDLAKKVNRDASFVASALNLSKLDESVGKLIDDNEVKVGCGLALVALQEAMRKLNPAWQFPPEALQKAKSEDVAAFTSWVAKQIEDARKGPRVKKEPAARLRKVEDVRAELKRATRDPAAPAGYVAALLWALRQDPVSAHAEGTVAPAAGEAGDGPRLRAELARLTSDVEELEVHVAAQKAKSESLQKEVERLNLEIDQRDGVIKALEKGRKPEA